MPPGPVKIPPKNVVIINSPKLVSCLSLIIKLNFNLKQIIKNTKTIPSINSEYLIDDLPKEAKQLLMGLKTVIQTKMYEDTLKLIAIRKK